MRGAVLQKRNRKPFFLPNYGKCKVLRPYLEVQLQRLDVVVEPECGHGEQDVLAVDRLALLGLGQGTETEIKLLENGLEMP